jgi:hypothetical protein
MAVAPRVLRNCWKLDKKSKSKLEYVFALTLSNCHSLLQTAGYLFWQLSESFGYSLTMSFGGGTPTIIVLKEGGQPGAAIVQLELTLP